MCKKLIISILFVTGVSLILNAQDFIIKENGDEIKAKILEIGLTEIKYKNFNNQSGPTYTIPMSSLFMIKYENGVKDMIENGIIVKTIEPQQPVIPVVIQPATVEVPKPVVPVVSEPVVEVVREPVPVVPVVVPQTVAPVVPESVVEVVPEPVQVIPVEVPQPIVSVVPEPVLPTVPEPVSPVVKQSEKTSPVVKPDIIDKKQSEKEIIAIDYVIYLKDLVVFFDKAREGYDQSIKKIDYRLNECIEKIEQQRERIRHTEKELDDEIKIQIKKTKRIKELEAKLKSQKKELLALRTDFYQQETHTINWLRAYETRQLELINQRFNGTVSKIEPTTGFPAWSKETATISFSTKVDNYQLISLIKSAEQFIYWFQEIEHSFYSIIESSNQPVRKAIEKDKELEVKLLPKKKQLVEYNLNKKVYKNEMAELSKEISILEKEREEVQKQMKRSSILLSTQMKQYNKDIQNSLREKIKIVIEKLDFKIP